MGKDKVEGAQRQVTERDLAERHFKQAFSNLAGFVNGGAAAGYAIRVAVRGQYDYLAVANRTDEGGVRMVCFGNGESFFGALAALNRSLAQGAWKVDRYQPGG